MKKWILSLALLSSFTLATRAQSPTLPAADLRDWITALEGAWVDQGYVEALLDGSEVQPELKIEIRLTWLEGDRVRIRVSEYCDGAIADFLYFRLAANGEYLELEGALLSGCFLPLSQLEYLRIGYEWAGDRLRPWYQVREIDGRYTRRVFLAPDPFQRQAIGYRWQCEWQEPILTLLTEGNFQAYNAEGLAMTLEEAFGYAGIYADLQFMRQYPNLLTGMEELCATAPFPVVTLGSLHPQGELFVFAVEEGEGYFRLYHTIEVEADDRFADLRRGRLFLELVPAPTVAPAF